MKIEEYFTDPDNWYLKEPVKTHFIYTKKLSLEYINNKIILILKKA